MNSDDLLSWSGFWHRPRSSPARIRRWQDARLRRLMRHAWRNVPFYRRRLEALRIGPEEIRGAADLPRLPVLTRADLFEAPFADLLARGTDPAACNVVVSSGTTGEPIRILRTRGEEYTLFAYRLRGQILSGLRPWHTRMKIGSAPQQTLPHRIGVFRCGNVSDRLPPKEIVAELVRQRFDVLYAGPARFESLLAEVDESRLRALRPRLVFCGAEYLSRVTRARLETIFGCPVIDFYGAIEMNLLAWQCRDCGLFHTCDDAVLVEVIRDDGEPAGAGESGRVVATALHSFAMPLIRYDTGDVAQRPTDLPQCRIRFGCIDRIMGRQADYLHMPNGDWLSPHRLAECAEEVPGVRRYQAVQTGPAEIVLKVVTTGDFCEDSVRLLKRNFAELIPSEVRVEVRVVDDIPLTPAGKHRIVQAWRPDGSGAQVARGAGAWPTAR